LAVFLLKLCCSWGTNTIDTVCGTFRHIIIIYLYYIIEFLLDINASSTLNIVIDTLTNTIVKDIYYELCGDAFVQESYFLSFTVVTASFTGLV